MTRRKSSMTAPNERTRVTIVVTDVVDQPRKAWRKRNRHATILHNKEWRARSRADQRAGRPAVRCTLRYEPRYRTDEYSRWWKREVRRHAVATGRVGDVEWLVSPGGTQPSLNGYLVLPEGHLWLTSNVGDDDPDEMTFYALGEEHAPREYTFRRDNYVGIDSGHYNDVWDYEELRAVVKPWPYDWKLWERYAAPAMRKYLTTPAPWDDYNTHWTVPLWTARVKEWARAASEAPRG
jgi:hypothetical protein